MHMRIHMYIHIHAYAIMNGANSLFYVRMSPHKSQDPVLCIV